MSTVITDEMKRHRVFLDELNELCKKHQLRLSSSEPMGLYTVNSDDFIGYFPCWTDGKSTAVDTLHYSDIDLIHWEFENF